VSSDKIICCDAAFVAKNGSTLHFEKDIHITLIQLLDNHLNFFERFYWLFTGKLTKRSLISYAQKHFGDDECKVEKV
jgi:hypothetical protein